MEEPKKFVAKRKIYNEIELELEKIPRPCTEGILAVLNHNIGTEECSYKEYQKLLQERYYTIEHIKKAIKIAWYKAKSDS